MQYITTLNQDTDTKNKNMISLNLNLIKSLIKLLMFVIITYLFLSFISVNNRTVTHIYKTMVPNNEDTVVIPYQWP